MSAAGSRSLRRRWPGLRLAPISVRAGPTTTALQGDGVALEAAAAGAEDELLSFGGVAFGGLGRGGAEGADEGGDLPDFLGGEERGGHFGFGGCRSGRCGRGRGRCGRGGGRGRRDWRLCRRRREAMAAGAAAIVEFLTEGKVGGGGEGVLVYAG
jgi:hypothetical protein